MSAGGSRLQSLIGSIAGADSAGDIRLRRTLLFMLAAFSSVAGLVWGSIYLALGEWQVAVLPYVYALLSAPSLFLGRFVRRLDTLIRLQFVLIMAIPFLLSLALGGFVGSSAVILWALLGPVGSFLISGRRGAVRWLAAYLALLVTTWVIAPNVGVDNGLPDWVILTFYVLSVGSVSAIAFGLLYYFVGENQRVLELLQLEKTKSERPPVRGSTNPGLQTRYVCLRAHGSYVSHGERTRGDRAVPGPLGLSLVAVTRSRSHRSLSGLPPNPGPRRPSRPGERRVCPGGR